MPLPLISIEPMADLEPRPAGLELSTDLAEVPGLRSIEEMARWSRQLLEDLTFPTVRAWTKSGKKAVACFPVYTPQEIVHALGMLPVLVQGGGENIEITHADAPLGSFLCSVSKSTLELAITARLAPFSAFVFPYICDVSRNLEGIFSRILPDRVTHMLHLPQNFTSAATVPFLVAEYQRLIAKLEGAGGEPFRAERLQESLELYNRHRETMAALRELRRAEPWKLSLVEYYLLRRVGNLLPRELHLEMVERAVSESRDRQRRSKDAIRVALIGPFCEQPTLDLLELLEEVGCYVVDDDLQMLYQWYGSVPSEGDPLRNLAAAYVNTPVDLGVRSTPTTKGEAILDKVGSSKAQGVIFLTAKFCEPALEDVVLYRRALEKKGIPYLHMEFEEKSSSYDQSRLQLETFVESILFD